MTRIKICCIQSIAEARMAIGSGASAIGLVGKMPSGPGPIEDDLIREIAAALPPPIATFLLTSESATDAIIRHHQRTQTTTIQIVDTLIKGTHAGLKMALPAIKIVQVIHVMDAASVAEAIKISESVDALLLDSGNPGLRVKELGGTGRVHDWRLSRQIRMQVHCPVFLAGGLTPENVREAIETVEPFAVDVCSGVRTDGHLDIRKMERFIEEVQRAQ
ncbi:MAG TPA: phosphoribosylanthranilate isomerase [bacterium]|nr:phosphoribosylanthranilate isomerase [bacterium]HQG47044.1 phosphoribosylanthranilate isomerase [bacterium]HQI48501.1 phosphoribosylanthranilate isomerase [bacterium]HQJ65795.1 phosphoribosylanthranilate isomerase [bacterium]